MSTRDAVSNTIGRFELKNKSFIDFLISLVLSGNSNSITLNPNTLDIIRYGEPSITQHEYPARNSEQSIKDRLLSLNSYLLDGVLPYKFNHQPVQNDYENPNIKIVQPLPKTYWKSVVKEAVTFAVWIRAAQIFLDGNHRTSILYLHERLAESGILINDANDTISLDLYTLISHRHCKKCAANNTIFDICKDSVIHKLCNYIKRRITIQKEQIKISDDTPAKIKDLKNWNSFVSEWEHIVLEDPHPQEQYRRFKKSVEHHKRFSQFVRLTRLVLRY